MTSITERSPERAQFLADIITTAVEGGIDYWSELAAYKWADLPADQVFAVIGEEGWMIHGPVLSKKLGRKITTVDMIEAGHLYMLNVDTIEVGIQRVLDPTFEVRGSIRFLLIESNDDNDASMVDAEIADVIVQAACFSKLVYG